MSESAATETDLAMLRRLNSDTVMEVLGIEFVQASGTRVIATMPVDRRHVQIMGILHGGVSVLLAETVASTLAYLGIDRERQVVFGLEINANHLRPVRPGARLTAEATPIHRGKTTVVAQIVISDERGRTVSVSRCTNAVRERSGTDE
jgi:uncharacterized protein (TIGR00369 family)